VFDTETFALLGSRWVPTGFSPRSLVATSGGFAAASGTSVLLVDPTVSATPPSFPRSASPTPFEPKSLALSVKGLVADTKRGLVYGAVSSTSSALANEVVGIDPKTATIVRHLSLGSGPGPMAVSDDASVLYVGIQGASGVAKVDLESFTLASTFPVVDPVTKEPRFVDDLVAMPGRADLVAASLIRPGSSTGHVGNVVYDDGVALPTATPLRLGGNRIEAGASAEVVYGINQQTTGYEFYKMAVDAGGIRITATQRRLISSSSNDIKFVDGLLYANSGVIVDPEVGEQVGRLATLYTGPVEVDPDRGRAFLFTGASLSEFEIPQLRVLGSLAMPTSSSPVGLVRTSIGLAAATSNQVIFFNPPTCNGVRATINAEHGLAIGTAGDDVIAGSNGSDTINGGGGHDLICGAGGNDTITGGAGRDVIIGGFGDDTLSGGAGGDDIDGGDGNDSVIVGADATPRVIDLDDVADDGTTGEGDNVRSTNEHIVGSAGPDTITGSPAPE
jgi:hypothetical protein